MGEILEAVMVVLFGVSWPINIIKSVKSRTAKGRSPWFLICIMLGYLAGIASKIVNNNITYVFIFYVINLVMVIIDFCFVLRNIKLDKKELVERNV